MDTASVLHAASGTHAFAVFVKALFVRTFAATQHTTAHSTTPRMLKQLGSPASAVHH